MTTSPESFTLKVADGDPEPELARRGVPARPTPGAAPPPIREPLAVRRLLIETARAGADVLTAPTARTGRRALVKLGEARRAGEWTAAAVTLAREAAAMAAEQAEEDATRLAGEGPDIRGTVARIAGLLVPLEGRDAPDLAPDEATALGEHRAQAGILADAGVDLLRVDGMGTLREAHAAALAVAELGLEVWAGVSLATGGSRLLSGEPLEAWLEAILPLNPAALLVRAERAGDVDVALGRIRAATDAWLGADLPAGIDEETVAASVERWLEAGATIVGCGDDSTPARIAACRAAVDRWVERHAGEAKRVSDAWSAWLGEGARRASGGRAVAILEPGVGGPPAEALAGGNSPAWLVVPPGEIVRLPPGQFALCVVGGAQLTQAEVTRLAETLAPGGWLLVAGAAAAAMRRLAEEGRLEQLQPVEVALDPPVEGWLGRRRR